MPTASPPPYLEDTVSKHRQSAITEKELLNVVSPYAKAKTRDALFELREMLQPYSDFQRLCLLYRLITDHVRYDYRFMRSSYYYLAVLKRREGVCASISAFLFLMARASLSGNAIMFRIIGDVDIRGEMTPHAWNAVEIDTPKNGRDAFLIDATWDLGKKPGQWSWFLRGANIPGRTWDSRILPHISERNCSASIFIDEEKSEELAHWFSQLGTRFENSMYRLN